MITRPHVALIIETSKQYGRGLIKGIGQYVKGHGPWSIFIEERSIEEAAPKWLTRWKGDGIIARMWDETLAKPLMKMGVPVVNVRRYHTRLPLPAVYEDDFALCRLAMRHFAEHHFRNLAFCGWEGIAWAQARAAWFAQAVREGGHGECHMYKPRTKGVTNWEREQEDVARWLESLPKPVGVLACNDVRGLQVLDACRRINLPVPEQCAVLGVDNDTILCELADPPLSSIDQDEERTGYEAAALLDKLMRGEKDAPQELLIPPLGVVTRASTDSIAVEDADLAKALRFIRLNACSRISIDNVADHVGLSRRALQRRFRTQLGRTPSQEISTIQLQQIKQMLAETDLKLQVVAERAGFHYVSHLSSFFKSHTGLTPGKFRQQAQGGGRGAAEVKVGVQPMGVGK